MAYDAGSTSGILPEEIRSRFIPDVNGLRMHVLEAGTDPDKPCVILLHGFPELAYSWRKMMGPLASAGYHVVAPDQRGFGRTTGWDGAFDGDLASFRMLNRVRDVIALLNGLGRESVAAVIGHDSGSPVAAWCALLRPDLFQSTVLMSAPFPGPPPGAPEPQGDIELMNDALARLPRPRKHYQWYYSTRTANQNMLNCPQGVHDFLRAYYHYKSADWKGNDPHPIEGWEAAQLAELPTYYIMDIHKGMAETVAAYMPCDAQIRSCEWLPDEELEVYSSEYERTGFQGGLQGYWCGTDPRYRRDLEIFSDRRIDVPAAFIAGRSDWGVYQRPGHFEAMQDTACTDMRRCELIPGAGHWVQQEAPARTTDVVVEFLQHHA